MIDIMIKINFRQYTKDRIMKSRFLYTYIKNRVWFGWHFDRNRGRFFKLRRLDHPVIRKKMCLDWREARVIIMDGVLDGNKGDVEND